MEKKTSKNNSEIAKILQQVQKGEKKRIKEKNMAKQAKLEAKRKKKEEKYLAKQIEQDQAEIIDKKTYKSCFSNTYFTIENNYIVWIYYIRNIF